MSNGNGPCLARGMAAGIAGGLVASLLMNLFIESVGPKLTNGLQTDAERARAEREAAEATEEPAARKEDATMKAAGALAKAFAGRELTYEQKQVGGPIVHYAFGAAMGGLYGALSEYSPIVTAGAGAAYGGVLFAGADMIAVPALNLSGSSGEATISSLATPFAAHLVYGAVTEMVRRLLRATI